MIGLIQRVNYCRLRADGADHSAIDEGVLALVGIEKGDTRPNADKLLHKILAYRMFNDAEDKMNLSVGDIGGGLMLVSQFTLAAETTRGLRPGFSTAMPPGEAEPLYDYLVATANEKHSIVATGVFGADMQIDLQNNGPVTFILRG